MVKSQIETLKGLISTHTDAGLASVYTVCPGSSYLNLYNELLYKLSYYLLDTRYVQEVIVTHFILPNSQYI